MAKPEIDHKIRYSDIITWGGIILAVMGAYLKTRDGRAEEKVQMKQNTEMILKAAEINERQSIKLSEHEIWQIKHDARIEALQEAGIAQ